MALGLALGVHALAGGLLGQRPVSALSPSPEPVRVMVTPQAAAPRPNTPVAQASGPAAPVTSPEVRPRETSVPEVSALSPALSPAPVPVPEAEGPAQTSAPEPAPDPTLWDRYRATLRRSIEDRRVYPYAAQARGQEGTVVLGFSLDQTGSLVRGPVVIRSSGTDRLDRAGVEAVTRAAPFPPLPEGSLQEEFTVPIVFKLRSSSNASN